MDTSYSHLRDRSRSCLWSGQVKSGRVGLHEGGLNDGYFKHTVNIRNNTQGKPPKNSTRKTQKMNKNLTLTRGEPSCSRRASSYSFLLKIRLVILSYSKFYGPKPSLIVK